jgi:hypothetical protein
MLQSFEGIIDKDGKLKISDQVQLPRSRRVIITVLNDGPEDDDLELALLSESALAREWDRPEEDEAWLHLAQLPSL